MEMKHIVLRKINKEKKLRVISQFESVLIIATCRRSEKQEQLNQEIP